MLLGCVCVLKLNLYACHLEKWTTLCDFLGRNAHLEVHTTWVTQKSYSGFQQILKFKHLLGADVECCNFLFEKSDTKCLFVKSRYQRAASVCTNSRDNL